MNLADSATQSFTFVAHAVIAWMRAIGDLAAQYPRKAAVLAVALVLMLLSVALFVRPV